MTTKPGPLLPQLLDRIPADVLRLFRMEGEGGGQGAGAGQGGGGTGQAPPTFSQADLDRIVGERVARERGKFADYDDLKAKAQQYDQHAEATKTEHEKALDKARQDSEKAARTDERTKWSQRILSAEVKALAGGKLADPADAVRLLDMSKFTVDDDGNVDPKAVAGAIDELLKAKPYLGAGSAAPRRAPDLHQGARGGGADGAGAVDANAWLRDLARNR